jgi:hypothetical protein
MLPEWYLRIAAASGPSFVASWSSADVAIIALVVFTVGYALAAALAATWPLDVAFAALVAGGVAVAWPAMVALTIAAVFVAIAIGFVHKWVAPERQARIDRESEAIASKAVADFERDLGQR